MYNLHATACNGIKNEQGSSVSYNNLSDNLFTNIIIYKHNLTLKQCITMWVWHNCIHSSGGKKHNQSGRTIRQNLKNTDYKEFWLCSCVFFCPLVSHVTPPSCLLCSETHVEQRWTLKSKNTKCHCHSNRSKTMEELSWQHKWNDW